MKKCPCGSQKNYPECCEPYISGRQLPATAEALMRSRYTAFAQREFEYIAATMLPPAANHFNLEDAKQSADDVQWTGLDVIKAEDDIVEFRAHYRAENKDHVMHERSRFVRRDGKWFYVEGVHLTDKVGRNDVCTCGSGKKFKKCCGK